MLLSVLLLSSVAVAAPDVRRDIIYAEPEGASLRADVWSPEGDGPFPAVLLIHGGGWHKGERGHMDGIAKRLVRRGLVVVNISYRLAPEHRYPAAVDDARAALRWMKSSAATLKLDPERVAAWGYSAGAHIAGLIAYDRRPGEELTAVVLGGTPADLRRYPKSPMVLKFLGKTINEAPDLYAEASLNPHVGPGDTPTYLYHAKGDLLVRKSQAVDLAADLKAAGVPVELDLVPFAGHVTLFVLRPAAVERAADYLVRRLSRPVAGPEAASR